VLLLWISFIIIIPFDLSRLDGSLQGQSPIVDQILSIAKVWSVNYLKPGYFSGTLILVIFVRQGFSVFF